MNVDVNLVAAQPSRSGYPRIIDAPKEAVAANLATQESRRRNIISRFCCTASPEVADTLQNDFERLREQD